MLFHMGPINFFKVDKIKRQQNGNSIRYQHENDLVLLV